MTARSHSHSFHPHLRTKPIAPHSAAVASETVGRFGKPRIAADDPVAAPKPHPRYIAPPMTNLTNLSLPLDLILPDETQAATDAGMLVFHSVGDTGGIHGDDVEKTIAEVMDHQVSHAGKKSLAPA